MASALKGTSTSCALFTCKLDSYVDGELDPGRASDVAVHVGECPVCSERASLAKALRYSLRRTAAGASHKATASLRARMATFIGEERQKPKSTWGPLRGGRKLIPMHYAMALATIAGALSAAAVARVRPMSMLEGTSGIFVRPAADNLKETTIQSASATSGIEGMLDDLVALHKYPPVPETTNPEELQRFDLEVGVPVRRPAFQPFDGQFKGARLYMTRDARAALLQYTVKGWHRVTVYVFDPRVLPMRTAPGLDRRVVRDRPVYFGRRGGYSIAAAEQGGVGIALASDLDADDSARLALAAVPQSP